MDPMENGYPLMVEMLVIPRLELSILRSRSELTCRRPLQLFVTPHTCHALEVPPPADNNMAECVKRHLSLHNARQHQLQPYQQAEIQIVS